MTGNGEIHAMREESRLAPVHNVFHILAAEREPARCTNNDTHIGNVEIVEKRFRKRIYITTRTADVLIISHLPLKYIHAIVHHRYKIAWMLCRAEAYLMQR